MDISTTQTYSPKGIAYLPPGGARDIFTAQSQLTVMIQTSAHLIFKKLEREREIGINVEVL